MRNEGGALFESRGISRSMLICSRAFAASTLLAILSVWLYRCMYLFCPSFLLTSTLNDHRIHNHGLVWIGMFAAEVWFGLYWILTQAARWNPIYRRTFKDNLTNRTPANCTYQGGSCPQKKQRWSCSKRWSGGDLQILLSKYSPASYGFGRINPGLIMGYCMSYSGLLVACQHSITASSLPSIS